MLGRATTPGKAMPGLGQPRGDSRCPLGTWVRRAFALELAGREREVLL